MAFRTQSGVRAVVCLLTLAVLFASTVGGAAAAGTTDIGVVADRDALAPGEATTVEVVVVDADGGVGALNATVSLSNPDVASVESVTLHGNPDLKRITDRADGVGLSAVLADTEDVGHVIVATVVLRGEEPGRTSVDVDLSVLGDEDGTAYSVGTVDRPTIAVNDVSESSSDDRTAPRPTDGETSGDNTVGPAHGNDDSDDADSGDIGHTESDDSGDADSGDTSDGTSDEERAEIGGSTPGEQSVKTGLSPISEISAPALAIGIVVIGALVLRLLR
ncbi:hypothetical protein [Halobellus marinus]|uniref:hypothetical protein n=1 Tax=Halobellus TaxID=1073986 RepID=UPI0028B1B2B2|nr:hypothetical protein [Halobellus sp. DFY28]